MSVFNEFLWRPRIWIGPALIFGFWPLTIVLPTMAQNEWLQILRVVIGFAVVRAYAPGAWRAVRSDAPSHALQLAAGIALNALGSAVQGVLLVVWRLADQPLWMINNDLNGWFVWLQTVGWALHITAPGAIDGDIPRTNVIRLFGAFAAGLALGAVVVAYHPELSAFFERAARPAVQDLLKVAP